MSSSKITQLRSHVVADEGGLITMFLDDNIVPDGLAQLPRALRVRLNPPEDELREDMHVFDLDAACAFAEERVLSPLLAKVPGVRLTDVATGTSRFTLGLRFPKDVDAKKVKSELEQLDIGPWAIEEMEVVNDAAGKRERGMLEEFTMWDQMSVHDDAHPRDADIASIIEKLPKQGSFAEEAGLGEQLLDADSVVAALAWLEKRLASATAHVRAAKLDDVAADVRLCAYVNCHPSFRQYHFEVRVGPDDFVDMLAMPKACAALAQWLDAGGADVRRVPGVIWDSGAIDGELGAKYRHVVVDASS